MPAGVALPLTVFAVGLLVASAAFAEPVPRAEPGATAAFPEAPAVAVAPATVPPRPTSVPLPPVASPPTGYAPPPPTTPVRADVAAPVILDEGQARSGRGEQWYGWQPLIIDGLSIPLLAASGAGGVTYLVGGPVVHLAHGRPGAALGSVGLRVGMPLAGGMVSLAAADCGGEGGLCGLWFIPGAIVGALGAIIIDASVLSWEGEPPPPALRSASRLRFALSVKPGDGGRVAVGGDF